MLVYIYYCNCFCTIYNYTHLSIFNNRENIFLFIPILFPIVWIFLSAILCERKHTRWKRRGVWDRLNMYRTSDIREFSSNFVLSWKIVAVLLLARYMEKKLGEYRVTWMNLLIWSPRTDLCHVTPIAIRNKWPTYFLVNAGCSSNRNTVDKEAILREKKVDNVEWNFSYDDTFPKEPSFENLSNILRVSDKRISFLIRFPILR